MTHITQLAALDAPSATFGILKRGFDAHAVGIQTDQTRGCRQIGKQEPRFIMLWVPTGGKLAGKTMFFPHQDFPVPRRARFEQEIAAPLPVAIAATKLSATIGLILHAQDVMPLIALTEPDQWQGCQPTICQNPAVVCMHEAANLTKHTA